MSVKITSIKPLYKGFPIFLFLLTGHSFSLCAQTDRWQQQADYFMDIDMDVSNHQYRGKQEIAYTNNSPDTLTHLFYHLYFNAFQPNSMMDVRSRTLPDADQRVADRIQKLKPENQGSIRVESLSMDGIPLKFETNETILEVKLTKPILPHSRVLLSMLWHAQVPVQIRRSGRNNREGVAYSMTQWYPKLCEYDYQGWHSNPYIAREFYGVWGNFDVKITIDKNYVVAAGGYLQNPLEIGHGYDNGDATPVITNGKLTYHFKTPNVHDFAWAADPEYTHTKHQAADGTLMHFFWKKGKGYDNQWEKLPTIMDSARTFMNNLCGKYPYREYYFIQGGDGGMEYPLATLITGNRPLNSLVGVAVHEQLHSWYQMILGTNESLFAWMDEGFTSYAESWVENELARVGLLINRIPSENPWKDSYAAYAALAKSGNEEPLSTHADHFKTNYAYGTASYVKGSVFLSQLEYIIGKENLKAGLLKYFHSWKFKHPNVNDFIRIMETQAGLELDWYKEEWVNTTNTIDYSIAEVTAKERKETKVVIRKAGSSAMPLDIVVTYTNGEEELFYAPLESMRGEKPAIAGSNRTILPDHRWVDPEFVFFIPERAKKIKSIIIDPTGNMADINPEDNTWTSR